MSVTFAPEYVTNQVSVVSCSCGDAVSDVQFGSYQAAYDALYVTGTVATPMCDDEFCAAYTACIGALDEIPTVNVSNLNAREILSVLGVTKADDEEYLELCGSMPAEQFAGSVLLGIAVNPTDAGAPVVDEGNFVECGREVGYVDARLTELREVAEYALTHNLNVVWS
jgi:hypothetical protein